jgi:TonB family protein
MLEFSPKTSISRQEGGNARQERRRLLSALALLLVALGIVLVKNRDFWLGSEQEVASASEDSERSSGALPRVAWKPGREPRADVAKASAHVAGIPAKISVPRKETTPSDTPVVATNRTVLPPLEVEVIAGDAHHTIRPGSNVSKVEIADLSKGPAINAVERAPLPNAHAPEIRTSQDATYPLLGQHSRVQGSVVLRAVVGADGAVENLRVLSGPAILTTAAQQAVRQWRFKPVLQNGQAVETEATITVNFSIRVTDNTPSSI